MLEICSVRNRTVLFVDPLKPTSPHLIVWQSFAISEDDQSTFRSRDSHVEPARVGDEADVSRRVASHGAQNDHFLFSALESINGTYFELLYFILFGVVQVISFRTSSYAVFFLQPSNLRGVRRDDADVPGSR